MRAPRRSFPPNRCSTPCTATRADGAAAARHAVRFAEREVERPSCIATPTAGCSSDWLDSALDGGEPLRLLARADGRRDRYERRCSRFCATRPRRQCAAGGAAVLTAVGRSKESSSRPIGSIDDGARAAGSRSPARWRATCMRTRDVVSVEDFSGSARPLMKVVPELRARARCCSRRSSRTTSSSACSP